jgi:hypothetical protein
MRARAYELLLEAWNRIKGGDFFDEQTNKHFEYMLQEVWKDHEYKNKIQTEIFNVLPHLFNQIKLHENPPPFLFILISLKDPKVNMHIQEVAISDWIKSNASEQSTFQLLNIADTFETKGIDIKQFMHTTIKYMREGMDNEMLKAFAYMLCSKHQEYLQTILKKFYSFTNKALLKDFAHMIGRPAVLALMQFLRPNEVSSIIK